MANTAHVFEIQPFIGLEPVEPNDWQSLWFSMFYQINGDGYIK